jgi:hypothetical protein
MVDHSRQPEWLNAGTWYFGAQIAPQRLVFEGALASPRQARELAERHVAGLSAAVQFWNTGR